MKKFFSVLVIIFIAFSLTGKVIHGGDLFFYQDIAKEGKEKFIPEELIIGYADGIDMEESSKKVREKHNLTQLEKGYKANFEVVKTPKNKKLEDLITEISKEKDVKYVEYNFIAYAFTAPNDTFLSLYQWNFDDYGKTYSNGSTSNFGIQTQKAWDFPATGSGIIVAIIDTGIAYENYSKFKLAPDLANTTFVSPQNFTGRNPTSHANDDNGHGTHVAGTVAQSTNNNLGCAGIAFNATIMPVKVLGANGSGSIAAIVNGINWAVAHGAKVINMSLGGSGSTTLQTAVENAYSSGVVVVCAAGNNGAGYVSYPAAYQKSIAVGATRFDGKRASYSNYGTMLDIVAPGGDTSVDQNGDGYGDGILQQSFGRLNQFGYYYFQGTSMASPHVAGVVALMLSVNHDLTPANVMNGLIMSSKRIVSGGLEVNPEYGFGLVNAIDAVNWVQITFPHTP